MVRSRFACSRLILATGGFPAPRSGRVISLGDRPRRPRRAMLAAAAVTAGLAIIATVIGITLVGSPMRPAVDKGALQLLAKVADAAARQPAPHVRDSQFMYVETTAAVPSLRLLPLTNKPRSFPRHIHLKMITSQVWVPVDNLCRTGLERGITANGQISSSTFSGQQPGVKCPNIGWLNDPTYRLLQTLPTNPHALLAMIYRIERGHGPSPDQEAFVTIGDLLRNTIAPPEVTAALYRAAALIPGVTFVHNATDAIGRHGVAVGRIGPGVDGGVREELIFSRATLRLIGERTVIARTGVTTTATAIIARAFVDHRGQVPSAGPAPGGGRASSTPSSGPSVGRR
ncbi:MAG TPA: CU044_5270 family protein [Streptosporangiaceae bacterium]